MELSPLRLQYLVLFLIPLGTIWGNIFVCLGVYMEKRLRHRFNLFLVSLAISDLLCATLVMPVSAYQMIRGEPSRNRTLCLVWYSMDIFFTATTIIHLCTISLDRYLTLRRPLNRRRRLPKFLHSLIPRIFMSWFVPFAIAGPVFLFALRQHEQEWVRVEQYNLTVDSQQISCSTTSASTNDSIVLDEVLPSKSYKGCGPNNPSFVLTAIGVTFVLPLIIMTATYILTVKTLRHHMQQVKSMQLYANRTRRMSSNLPGQLRRYGPTYRFPSMAMTNSNRFRTTPGKYQSSPPSIAPPIENSTLVVAEAPIDRPVTCYEPAGEMRASPTEESLTIELESDRRNMSFKQTPSCRQRVKNSNMESVPSPPQTPTVPGDNDNDQSRAFDLELTRRSRRSNTHATTIDRIHSGKRAVRVIGVLFGLFVACYLPFFIVYTIDVLSAESRQWTESVIPHLEWLGYLSSMLNPVVYHSFNSTFRRTFCRIWARCMCQSTGEKNRAVWERRMQQQV